MFCKEVFILKMDVLIVVMIGALRILDIDTLVIQQLTKEALLPLITELREFEVVPNRVLTFDKLEFVVPNRVLTFDKLEFVVPNRVLTFDKLVFVVPNRVLTFDKLVFVFQ